MVANLTPFRLAAKCKGKRRGGTLAARTVPAAAHRGHHRARHTLPRDSDFATTPALRRLRPPGALQAAAPSALPCRSSRPHSSPLPRSRTFQAAGTDARAEKDECKTTRGRPCAARAPGGGVAAAAGPARDRSGFLNTEKMHPEHRE